MENTMRSPLGFIGAGNLTNFVTTGLCSSADPLSGILIADIVPSRTAAIAAKFPTQISIAENNQSLVDDCDTVLLAIRPIDTALVLKDLRFRPEQTIISVIALKTLAELKSLVAPCQNIVRVMPMPPVQEHLGTIPYYPQNQQVQSILERLAQPLLMQTEEDLNVITAVTGLLAPFYLLLDHTASWAVARGVRPDIAQTFTVNMFHSLAEMSRKPGTDLKEMIREAATPGGLNEQSTKFLTMSGAYEPFLTVLEDLLKRIATK
jgi:pyrroline-5-carboxylate reductase